MKTGNHYPRWKIVLSSPVTIIVFLIVIFFLGKAVLKVHNKVAIVDQKLENANNEYQKLIAREKTLKDRVDFLSTDIGKESELRAKYKAVGEGEQVAVILEDKTDASSSVATTTPRIGWWRSFWGFFGL